MRRYAACAPRWYVSHRVGLQRSRCVAFMQLITLAMKFIHSTYMYNLADSGFFKNFLYQGGVRATVSGIVEDLKFKRGNA